MNKTIILIPFLTGGAAKGPMDGSSRETERIPRGRFVVVSVIVVVENVALSQPPVATLDIGQGPVFIQLSPHPVTANQGSSSAWVCDFSRRWVLGEGQVVRLKVGAIEGGLMRADLLAYMEERPC
ncbi:MAG TPA: hypothetical protein PKW90_27830 [Myxococcota bacterium]|nr:hypothetical protein [Myxococcota bacterium]